MKIPPTKPVWVISPSLAAMSIFCPVMIGATKCIISVKTTVPMNPPATAFQILGFNLPPLIDLFFCQLDRVTVRISDHQAPVKAGLRFGEGYDPGRDQLIVALTQLSQSRL